jgi:transcriptional regulator with PAS, ATPase and Fis domain/uncharacterized protein HemY
MKTDSPKDAFRISELDLIESLLEQKRFKEALAEIRERENRRDLDRSSCEWGWFAHLAAKALRGLGRYQEALKKAQKAFEIFKNTPEHDKLAQIQFSLGVICSDLGDLRSAELHLRDAASTYRRVEDNRGITRAYNELSRICFTRGKYDTAIEYLNDGLEHCRQIKDQKLTATVLGNLGTVYMISDRWEKARESLTQSLELNQLCKNEVNVCNSYLSLGYLAILLRDFSAAEACLQKARRIIHSSGLARELAIYHEYSGSLKFARGDLDAAQDHFQEAIDIGEGIAPNSAIISQAYRLMAELMLEKGDYQQTSVACERSIRACREIGERLEEAIVHRTLARLYSRNGHPDDVKKSFAKATSILEDMGVRFELAKTYQCMGQCAGFQFWEKMKFLARAEDLTSRLDSPYYLARVHTDFAQLFIQNGRSSAAQEFLTRAKSVFERLGEEEGRDSVSALEQQLQAPAPISQPAPADSAKDVSFSDIITQDGAILEILDNARQVKDLDVTILLEGDTGTGKDLLAKAIHDASNRKHNRYVVVTCAALPESLFESELFGHKKGSFTGAVSDKNGLLHEGDGGTVFLDEIAEVPVPIQVKLLRAIEEKEIVRIGEVKPRKVDFRIIAATNQDLDLLVQEGRFRSDLFYRLNVMRFKLPPLRERNGDIPLLVERFVRKYAAEVMGQSAGAGIPVLDPKIMDFFLSYHWPGNVRQLDNEIRRLMITARGQDRIPFELLDTNRFENGRTPLGEPSLPKRLADLEKEEIIRALARANGVKTQAARILNIDEAKLRYRMKKHNITFPPNVQDAPA